MVIFLLSLSLFPVSSMAGVAALDLPTVNGPKGTTVTLPVTLTNGSGIGISGFNMDILYDSAVLATPTATLSTALSNAGFLLVSNAQVPGALRLGIIGIGVMSDGVAVNLSFAVSATAVPGTSTTLVNTVQAIDGVGNHVATTGTNGVINIIPAKPGDCDANGSVSIAEVQSAINMFLGLKPVAACVDVDGSSLVSISEVQKAINSFLGL